MCSCISGTSASISVATSAGNLCTMFYLYRNKHVALVNVCTLLFGHPSYNTYTDNITHIVITHMPPQNQSEVTTSQN